MELIIPIILIISALIFNGFYIVEQQKVAIVETFGKFTRIANAGLNFKIPFIQKISGKVSLRIQQLDVKAETKTKDNVFVHITVSVQFFVKPDSVYDAFYKLVDPTVQINSYVFDVIRSRVPRIEIDRLFEEKEEIASAIKEELNETMAQFGFEIMNSLVTDIDPDAKVKLAMNEINAAQRLKVAAFEKAEGEKIRVVKQAEAEAESSALHGKGIAEQRQAIINGLKQSVEDFRNGIEGTSSQEIMNLVLVTQYFDTLKEIGSKGSSIFVPYSPNSVEDIQSQVRNGFIQSNLVNRK